MTCEDGIPVSWCSNGSTFNLCIRAQLPGESNDQYATFAGKTLTAALKAHPKTDDCP